MSTDHFPDSGKKVDDRAMLEAAVRDHGDWIDAIIRLREQHAGRTLKPLVRDTLDGRRVRLSYAWTMDIDDPYPGEIALMPSDDDGLALFRAAGVCWIASGDVRRA